MHSTSAQLLSPSVAAPFACAPLSSPACTPWHETIFQSHVGHHCLKRAAVQVICLIKPTGGIISMRRICLTRIVLEGYKEGAFPHLPEVPVTTGSAFALYEAPLILPACRTTTPFNSKLGSQHPNETSSAMSGWGSLWINTMPFEYVCCHRMAQRHTML